MSSVTPEVDLPSWQIIVPVFNEADGLAAVLETISRFNYSRRITFVDDGSTDSSLSILREWEPRGGFKVIALEKNLKKEGAIREVLERQHSRGALHDYTILMDADSFLISLDGRDPQELVNDAIAHMGEYELDAMAFRIDAIVPPGWSLFARCIYADYAASQIDNWLTGTRKKLWVVNGPGGIFRSLKLLDALRSMVPDFETGDLLITVELMSQGSQIGFWPRLTVKTHVPASYSEYYRQRKRWERGTIKVLWTRRRFYLGLLLRRELLAVYTLSYLLFPVALLSLPLALCVADSPTEFATKTFVYNYVFWTGTTAAKCASNRWVREDGRLVSAMFGAFLNGILFMLATGPARAVGFWEAVRALRRHDARVDQCTGITAQSIRECSLLPRPGPNSVG